MSLRIIKVRVTLGLLQSVIGFFGAPIEVMLRGFVVKKKHVNNKATG